MRLRRIISADASAHLVCAVGALALALVIAAGAQAQTTAQSELGATFDRRLGLIRQDATAADPSIARTAETADGFRERLGVSADMSNNAAILRAFETLETSALDLLRIKGIRDNDTDQPIERDLERSAALTARDIRIFKDLEYLQNQIFEASVSVSKDQTDAYMDLLAGLNSRIKDAARLCTKD